MTALGDDATVPKILVLSDRTRVGKGLTGASRGLGAVNKVYNSQPRLQRPAYNGRRAHRRRHRSGTTTSPLSAST